MNPRGYALLGLTAIVAILSAIIAFALLRFLDAARKTRTRSRADGGEMALMSVALQEAVAKLKAQERATAVRAEASERFSEEIITSLTAGLVVAGGNREIQSANPAARRMLDVRDDDGPDAVRHALEDLSLWDLIQKCLDTGDAILRHTVSLKQPQHGVTHLGVTVSPLYDPKGNVHGAICLFTDLTAVKDLEQQLRLKESLATVGELTAGIAHEFRNGLATIQGYSKLLDVKALPETHRTYVEGIRAETESLSQVVTNFLSFARPAELVLSRVDLKTICERAADEIRADTRAAGGDVVVTGDFGVVDGDEVLLRQAFSNVLRNALEACTGASVSPRVTIRSEIDGGQKMSRIWVDDNGPGIPPDHRDRVFRPFFTSKRNGTGLGLALVQKIIVFHNGRIVAASSSSGGASLQISLPVAS